MKFFIDVSLLILLKHSFTRERESNSQRILQKYPKRGVIYGYPSFRRSNIRIREKIQNFKKYHRFPR